MDLNVLLDVSVKCIVPSVNESVICLNRFIDGFNTLGLLEDIRALPDLFHKLFVQDLSPLKIDDLASLFKITFSAQGTRERELEVRTVYLWGD